MYLVDTFIFGIFFVFIVFVLTIMFICLFIAHRDRIPEDEDAEQIQYLIDWKEKHGL